MKKLEHRSRRPRAALAFALSVVAALFALTTPTPAQACLDEKDLDRMRAERAVLDSLDRSARVTSLQVQIDGDKATAFVRFAAPEGGHAAVYRQFAWLTRTEGGWRVTSWGYRFSSGWRLTPSHRGSRAPAAR